MISPYVSLKVGICSSDTPRNNKNISFTITTNPVLEKDRLAPKHEILRNVIAHHISNKCSWKLWSEDKFTHKMCPKLIYLTLSQISAARVETLNFQDFSTPQHLLYLSLQEPPSTGRHMYFVLMDGYTCLAFRIYWVNIQTVVTSHM